MKIRIKRVFRYQVSAVKAIDFQPGVYDVGRNISAEIADSVLRFGKAEVVVEAPKPVEKKAPENKVVEVVANKAKVAKAPVHRRSTRSKPDA